ncbi:hypothetical protein VTI74DRAFT_5667 [Chaetomium olivicolor]
MTLTKPGSNNDSTKFHATALTLNRVAIKMLAPATLGAIIATASTVSAHGWIDYWVIQGQNYTGFNPTIAPWSPDQGTISWPAWNDDTGPVYSSNVGSPDIICQINATNSKKYATPIAAGTTIQLALDDLARLPSWAHLLTKLKWFKIAQLGQFSYGAGGGSPGVWAADQLRAAGGSWSVTIPASIKAGNYVLRNEILALHSAYDVGAAQFYPQCANIKITGSGTATPSGVAGTSLYNENDPGVHYNIYNDEFKPVYQMPGPPLCTSFSMHSQSVC